MDLRHVRTFVTVAELGTVSKAALRLRIAQPALSRHIADLEQELGLKPPPVAMALKHLDEPTPMGRIADILCCDGSTVTWIVDRLEGRGLVERRSDPRDRRVRLVALTPEGRRVRDELRTRFAEPPPAIARLPASDQRA